MIAQAIICLKFMFNSDVFKCASANESLIVRSDIRQSEIHGLYTFYRVIALQNYCKFPFYPNLTRLIINILNIISIWHTSSSGVQVLRFMPYFLPIKNFFTNFGLIFDITLLIEVTAHVRYIFIAYVRN